jgi:16S rRNA C967 or C1407 C5-methylase (RsmB/RsmF family)
LQKLLIDKAGNSIRKGGFIIYSTCSLEPEENEEIIEYMLDKKYNLIDLKIKGFSKGLSDKTKNAIRIWPTQNNLPAFFIACLRKDF